MSGGSFNYLYCRPLEEAIDGENFARMADALGKYPDGARAALELRSIRSAFDALSARWVALGGVMQSVEWDHSGDRIADDVDAELAKYNAGVGPLDDADKGAAYQRMTRTVEQLTAELRALAPKETT
jgi:hypothetical protein